MAIKIGRFVIGVKRKGPGRPAKGSVLIKDGSKKTGNQGGQDVRKKT